MANSAPIVYAVFASIFLGLALMCVIGYFAIRPLVKILDMPEAVVSAYVLILCFIGALSIRPSEGMLPNLHKYTCSLPVRCRMCSMLRAE